MTLDLLQVLKQMTQWFYTFLIIMSLSFGIIGCSSQAVIQSPVQPVQAEPTFYGVNRVSPEELDKLFPDLQDRPYLVQFTSKLCRDCKKMEPILAEVQKGHPGVTVKKLDVARDKHQYHAVFDAFQPTIVPILLFIDAKGEIRQVYYGFHDRQELESAFSRLDV